MALDSIFHSAAAAGRSWLVGLCAATAGCTVFYPIREKVDSDAAIDDGGGSDVVNEDGGYGCTSDQQCGASDLPAFCGQADHTCRPLPTQECRIVYPRTWRDPHAIFLGAYALLRDPNPEASDLVWNYELAIQEFNDRGGLPDANGTSHTLVTVICNNDEAMLAKDADFLSRSLDHLTSEVGVSAIVADLPPNELISAFRRTQDRAEDVFFLSPGPANNELARLDDRGLVWSMIGPATDLAPAYTSLLQRVEGYIRSTDSAVQSLRVALVMSSDASEPRHDQLGELIDALTGTNAGNPNPNRLEFNGQDLQANENAGNYQTFVVDAAPGSPAAVGQAVLDFRPHVVISMTGPQFTHVDDVAAYDGVADTVESRSTDRRYPFFILSPVNASASDDVARTIQSIAQGYPEIHRRFLGIDVATADDPTLYYQYLDRLRAPTAHPLAKGRTENYYDPIYYLAYAMYRAGFDAPVTGKNVLGGMNAMLAGSRYDVGPAPIPTVFSALDPRQPAVSIELVGTMGQPNFNPLTGTRVNRAALYCFPLPPNSVVHPQVQVYVDGTWKGDFDCFQGL